MQNEKADASVMADARIIRGAGMIEAGMACGKYSAVNVGPLERYRAKYVAISLEIEAAGKAGLIDRARWLREILVAVPMEKKWDAEAINHVMTEGANLALDTFLAGSGYTVVGPYMGLISSVSYTTTAIGDTAAQINGTNGWKEAGSGVNFPLYTTPRKTCAWSAASSKSKALSAALSFPIITTGGTVKGCFIIYGTGAVSTIADVNGKLWSAGVFSGGDKVVSVGDTLNVSYSAGL